MERVPIDSSKRSIGTSELVNSNLFTSIALMLCALSKTLVLWTSDQYGFKRRKRKLGRFNYKAILIQYVYRAKANAGTYN